MQLTRGGTLVLVAALAAAPSVAMAAPGARQLSRAVLEDKIRGGWAGQIIGVTYGGPTEFTHTARIIEGDLGPLTKWSPAKVQDALAQDDLYVEMTFVDVMDRIGLDATTKQYGDAFRDSKYDLWHANAAARRLLLAGKDAPDSSDPRWNLHANDIDFQIEADFIGLMTPGLPQQSNWFADRVGRVMNRGDGLYGGMFVAAMYAAAFFETDPRKVVEAGLAAIPSGSGYAAVLRDVLAWSKQEPDWKKTWQRIEDKWDRDDLCPDGALRPFNIDARLNGAYVALGLLYGGGDLDRTLDVSTRAGQDSDCNPASAAGVLGTMLGWQKIPDAWKSGIPAMATKKFSYTSYSFDDIIASNLKRALAVVARAGGTVAGDEITIPFQPPRAPKLEKVDLGGFPVAWLRVLEDDAWHLRGSWKPGGKDAGNHGAEAVAAGAEAILRFRGNGVVLSGRLAEDGGRADVFLDGKRVGQWDGYLAKGTFLQDVWWSLGLPNGEHELRLVTRDDANPASKGKRVVLRGATIYGRR